MYVRRMIGLVMISAMSLMFIACANQNVETETDSNKYLPTKIENIENGGRIPEGCEAKTPVEESKHSISSFWGNWVLKGSAEEDVHISDKTIEYTLLDEEGKPVTLTVECFPERLSFHPANISNDAELYALKRDAKNRQMSVFGQSGAELYAEFYDDSQSVPIEETIEKLGYGVGSVKLQGTENFVDTDLSLIAYGERAATYVISGDTFAIGLLDATCFSGRVTESPTGSNIYEIDYKYSWDGAELTLIYNEKKAVYIPECIENGETIVLDQAGITDGYSPIDGMNGISLDTNAGISQIMWDTHEGYVDAAICFDGTFVTIDGKKYSYAESEKSLTIFAEDGNSAVYSNYTFALQSFNNVTTTNFFVNDKEIRSWDTVGWFIENGFQTDLDLNQIINPYIVTDDFLLSVENSHITVKANNPYEKPVPLSACYVCYILIDDSDCIVRKGDSTIGKTSYDDINQIYEAAYEKKPDSLRYKTSDRGGIVIADFSLDKPYGIAQLEWSDYDVLYDFENDVLKSVRIEIPALLYNGLQDNVDYEALQNMDAATMTGVIKTRDDVLSKIKSAFEKAGIDAQIDELTGETVMDTNVLFGYDSVELSEEGKRYIDDFMAIYSSVVLDDSLNDVISEIRFEGHTDSSGSYEYNLNLSQRRADAVLNYCLSNDAFGLNRNQKDRLNAIATTVGYSYADLVYDSSGNEDADASRRVAVKFYLKVNG